MGIPNELDDKQINEESVGGLSRRTFMKVTGAAAGAGLFGTGITDSLAGPTTVGYGRSQLAGARGQQGLETGLPWSSPRTIGLTDTGIEARHPDLGPWNGILIGFGDKDSDGDGDTDHPWSDPFLTGGDDPFADIDPTTITPETPKVVGWYDANDQYGDFGDRPRDQQGHGTHVSSIMSGTGKRHRSRPRYRRSSTRDPRCR